MGEKETAPFQFTFNGFLKVAFQGSRVTSDAGLILVRELDERLGLDAIITEHLRDSRQGLNTQFRLPDLLRQSVYSRLAGYEDLNDAVRLAADPAFRLIGSPKRWDRSAALTSTLHWFETELLTHEDNLVGLMAVNRDLIGQAETCDRAVRIVLDMDSSESPVHGQQEGSAYNGHFESVCYHPLFLFTDHGDCVAAKLRPGNVSSADGLTGTFYTSGNEREPLERKESDMTKKRHTPEQIVTLLRQVEVAVANGKGTPQACKEAAITEQTYYRWRKEYGGLKLAQAKRLKELEKENSRLKHVVAELSLEKQILREVAQGNS